MRSTRLAYDGPKTAFRGYESLAEESRVVALYKGGSPALIDVISGQAHMAVATIPTANIHIRSGKIKALAVEGDHRIALLPDTPSYTEAGLPLFPAQSWFALFAPKGVPQPIVDKLGADLSAVIKDARMQNDFLKPAGLDPVGSTPDEFAKFLHQSIADGHRFVEISGVKID